MLRRLSEEERGRLEAEFLERARRAFRAMVDPKDESVQRTFADLETRACDVGDALTRFLLESRVGVETEAQPVEGYRCPDCGGPTLSGEDEPPPEREVVTRRGAVRLARPERACPACRRALFPPRP